MQTLEELIDNGQQLDRTDLELELANTLETAVQLLKDSRDVFIAIGCELKVVGKMENFLNNKGVRYET